MRGHIGISKSIVYFYHNNNHNYKTSDDNKYTNPAYRHSLLLQAKVGCPSLGTHVAIETLSIVVTEW